MNDGSTVLLGYDGESLACACQWEPARADDIPQAFFISAIARDNRYYATDCADLLMNEVLRRMRETNAEQGTDYGVYGKVEVGNHATQRWVRRHGFERFETRDGFEYWSRDLT